MDLDELKQIHHEKVAVLTRIEKQRAALRKQLESEMKDAIEQQFGKRYNQAFKEAYFAFEDVKQAELKLSQSGQTEFKNNS